MRQLIIVRHGDYDYDDHLSGSGKKQISALLDVIRSQIFNSSVSILTSSAPRASESANIIGNGLDLTPKAYDVLWAGTDSPSSFNINKVITLIQNQDAETVIIVTHLEYATRLPYFFGQDILKTRFPMDDIPKSTAWMIDCDAKTCEWVNPL